MGRIFARSGEQKPGGRLDVHIEKLILEQYGGNKRKPYQDCSEVAKTITERDEWLDCGGQKGASWRM